MPQTGAEILQMVKRMYMLMIAVVG